MTFYNAVSAGLAEEKLSRTITGSSQVSPRRTAVATAAGASIGAIGTGAIAVGASTLGASALATVAAPVVIPVAVVAGVVGFISSWFD